MAQQRGKKRSKSTSPRAKIEVTSSAELVDGKPLHVLDDASLDKYSPTKANRFTKLQKSYFQNITGVAYDRTQKHHRVVMNFLEPVLIKKSTKQAKEIMEELVKLTGGGYGNTRSNLINLSKELHTKDINAVHNLLQRYTSLQGIKQRDEFAPGTLKKIKWRGKDVEIGRLILGGKVENLHRFVGGQSGMSLEFIDMISKEKDSKKVAKLLAGLMEQTQPAFDGAIAAAVYLSDNPKLTLEHKKQVLRQLGPESQVWMEDFIKFIDNDTNKVLQNLRAEVALKQKQGKELTKLDQAPIDHQLKLRELVDGYKTRLEGEGLPFNQPHAQAAAASRAQELSDAAKGISKFQFEDFTPPPGTTFQGGDAAALAFDAKLGNQLLGNDLYKTLTNVVDKGDQIVSGVSDSWKLKKAQHIASLSDFSGAVKLGSLVPLLGLGFDALDMQQRREYIEEKIKRVPTYEGSESHQKDVAQLRLSEVTFGSGVAGVTVAPGAGQATNLTTGLGNLGTDIYRTFTEEDKRKEAWDSTRNLAALFGMNSETRYKPGSKGMELVDNEERRQETAETTIKGSEMFEPRESTEDTQEGVQVTPWNAYQLLKF